MDPKLEQNLSRENLTLATPAKRAVAFMVDEALITLLILIAFWERLAGQEDVLAVIETINALFFTVVGVKIAYQTLFVSLYGATLGKMWQRIVIIDETSFARPTVMAALMRAVVRIISEWLFYFGFLWALFNDTRQTWHDKLARTLVVNA